MWEWAQNINWPHAGIFFIIGGAIGTFVSGIIMSADRGEGDKW